MRAAPRVLVAATVTLSAACAGDRSGVRVLADPALAGALNEVARAFEAGRPGAPVLVEAATGAELPRRLEGAGVDVVATDDVPALERLWRDGLVRVPRRLATGRMILVTPSDNPAGVRGLEDLARPGVETVLPRSEVALGRRARDALEALGIREAVEQSAREAEDGAEFVEFALSAEGRRILAARGFGPT